MVCYHPVEMWVHRTKRTENGKRLIIHSYNSSLCADATKSLRPCGQCSGCLLRRSAEWATRCMHEASLYKNNILITLTYNDANLPPGKTLVKKHFQDFMKRLRKKYGPNIRYYYCGEYGDQFGRPHYHALLFNFTFNDKTYWRKTKQGFPAYRSKSLESLWTFGQSEIGSVTFESAAYVARYCLQKINISKHSPDHIIRAFQEKYETYHPDTGEIFYRLQEFTDMSRRPGIAHGWFQKFSSDVFPSDFIILNGRKIPPPKYYSGLFELLDPLEMEQIKFAREDEAAKHVDNNTSERLIIREQVMQSRIALLHRTLD